MSDGKVVIDTELNNKGFSRDVKNMSGNVGGLTDSVKRLGVAIGVAFGVKAIIDFSKRAIELGSNIAEVQNVVDVAFGDMAYKIEEFSKSSIQNFGMSRLAAKKTASTYMAMARGMGINERAASDMAIAMTGLSGDVASFYNISQELADIKLKSVFTGETETLKDLGVVMTQANLKAYALSHGISKSIDKMSQAELVGLRYNFVLDQLSLAQGDFARTSDSWANQTRILSMQWQEFMSIIGQALINVLTPVVKMLNNIVSALISMANTFNAVISSLFGGANNQIQQTASSATEVSSAIGGSVDNQNELTDATKATAKEQKKLVAGFDDIKKLSDGASGPSKSGEGGSGPSCQAVPALNIDTTQMSGNEKAIEFFKKLSEAVKPTIDAIGRLWDKLKLVGSFAGDALVDFYNTFLVPVGKWVFGEGLPRFIDAITNGLGAVDWQSINDALHKLWEALAPFAVNVGEGLLWLWENVLVPFGTWVGNEIIPRFLSILSDVIEILNKAIEKAKPAFLWLWNTFLKPLAEFTGGMILSLLDEFHGWLEIIAGILTGDFDRAVSGAKEIVGAWGDRFTYVKNLALSAWDGIKIALAPVVAWFNEHIITPITKGFKGFINGLIGMVEGFVNFFIRGVNGIISALNTIRVDIPDWVPGIGGNSFGVNLPTVSELKLPRLATGAVIPPNREFMAVLGDQKSGTNIEAPLSTIEQAVENVLRRRGYNGGGNQTVILEVDKRQLGKVVYQLNKSEHRRIGVSLVGV